MPEEGEGEEERNNEGRRPRGDYTHIQHNRNNIKILIYNNMKCLIKLVVKNPIFQIQVPQTNSYLGFYVNIK